MCGICAYIGYCERPYDKIHFALQMLQNRGYDSMGVAAMCPDLIIKKKASTPDLKAIDFISSLKDDFPAVKEDEGSVFMGHSRWRTCGSRTDINAHPHQSYDGKFVLVHNGIISNYRELKKGLSSKGITFKSETDSEVIVNLIADIYKDNKNVEESIRKALFLLEGTWGLVIMCVDDPDRLYCVRHGSPILVGFGQDFMMVSSEQVGFSQYVDNYICLKEKDLVILEKRDGTVKMIRQADYELFDVTVGELQVSPDPFPHWTLKEIYEQRESSLRAFCGRILNESEVRLGGLNMHKDLLLEINHLIILGCGTSYYAGSYSLQTFRNISDFETVQIFDGAQFDKSVVPKSGKTGLLLLSQSGETKDLHRALEIGKELDLVMIGVVNVVDSMIAREVDCGVYLTAGREVGVASTKCFTSQVIVLHLIAVWFAQYRNKSERERKAIIEGLRSLSEDIDRTLDMCDEAVKEVAQSLVDFNQPMFLLGRGYSEAIAKEAALKIKELSYIFCEAYNSSALKHGPYSCISENTPVIVFVPNDQHLERNLSVIDELKSRDAYVIAVTSPTVAEHITDSFVIPVPANKYFESLLGVLPIQLLAYYTALKLGNSVDQPRGLAKTVTTD